MAWNRLGQHDMSYIADTVADLRSLPKSTIGSTCLIIETGEKYVVNSKGEWILQPSATSGGTKMPPLKTINGESIIGKGDITIESDGIVWGRIGEV